MPACRTHHLLLAGFSLATDWCLSLWLLQAKSLIHQTLGEHAVLGIVSRGFHLWSGTASGLCHDLHLMIDLSAVLFVASELHALHWAA